jgi:hypothetical protein
MLVIAGISGMYIITQLIANNAVRGDEFLSFLHSSPQWDSLKTVIRNIHAGTDNSYTHAAALYLAFSAFGHTIIVQRLVSFAFWIAGMFILKKVLNKGSHNSLWVLFGVFMIAFSNFGIYLATDGRFYAILIFFAAIQILIYSNRNEMHSVFYGMLLCLTQLAGLLTSSNFILLQCVFLPALILSRYVFKHRDEQQILISTIIATALSSFIYFQFLKITYFHHFFLQNLFTAKTFDSRLLVEFLSTPFRWVLIPHLPYLSDQLDVAVFCAFLCVAVIIKRKELKNIFETLSEEYPVIDIMASVLFAVMCLQLILMAVFGFPLWTTRYYTPVFFTVAVVIAYLLYETVHIRVLLLVTLAMCFRLYAVEYPKIALRKGQLVKLNTQQQELIERHKPIVFVETETDNSMFSHLGNMQVHHPEMQEQLLLRYDDKDTARMNYFLRLKELKYPLHFTTSLDSENQTLVMPDSR